VIRQIDMVSNIIEYLDPSWLVTADKHFFLAWIFIANTFRKHCRNCSQHERFSVEKKGIIKRNIQLDNELWRSFLKFRLQSITHFPSYSQRKYCNLDEIKWFKFVFGFKKILCRLQSFNLLKP